MRFTVIGAGGFVGSRLLSMLEAQGEEVFAPDRHDESWLGQDLGHVFYCAGLTNDFLRRPFATVEAHVSLLVRLLEGGRFERLVYLSSTRLYDSTGAAQGDESTPLQFDSANSRHLFDLSKALGENLCLTTAPGRTASARLSCVYSDQLTEDGFLSDVLPACAANAELLLSSSRGFARDYVHIDDVTALLKDILIHGKQGIYNVAAGCNTSNAELFDALYDLCGTRIHCSRSDMQLASVISIARAAAEFGFRPRQLIAYLPVLLEYAKARNGT